MTQPAALAAAPATSSACSMAEEAPPPAEVAALLRKGLRSCRHHALAEAALVLCWTKSGLDFAAPLAWLGSLPSQYERLLFAVSCCWLTGCACMAASTLELTARPLGSVVALMWLAAGCCYSATLSAPSLSLDLNAGVVAWGGVLSAACWVAAACYSLGIEVGLISSTRSHEAVTIVLWLGTGVMFFGACLDDGLNAHTRWMYLSSTLWWCFGVAMWLVHFLRGGSFLGNSSEGELEIKRAAAEADAEGLDEPAPANLPTFEI